MTGDAAGIEYGLDVNEKVDIDRIATRQFTAYLPNDGLGFTGDWLHLQTGRTDKYGKRQGPQSSPVTMHPISQPW